MPGDILVVLFGMARGLWSDSARGAVQGKKRGKLRGRDSIAEVYPLDIMYKLCYTKQSGIEARVFELLDVVSLV